jgi:hypothetical protein
MPDAFSHSVSAFQHIEPIQPTGFRLGLQLDQLALPDPLCHFVKSSPFFLQRVRVVIHNCRLALLSLNFKQQIRKLVLEKIESKS